MQKVAVWRMGWVTGSLKRSQWTWCCRRVIPRIQADQSSGILTSRLVGLRKQNQPTNNNNKEGTFLGLWRETCYRIAWNIEVVPFWVLMPRVGRNSFSFTMCKVLELQDDKSWPASVSCQPQDLRYVTSFPL